MTERAARALSKSSDKVEASIYEGGKSKIQNEKGGRDQEKHGNLDFFKKLPDEKLLKDKRIYRTKDELFDETQPPKSEANRLSLKLGTRISRKHVKLFNTAASQFDKPRAALERAIELLADDLGVDVEKLDLDDFDGMP